MKSFVQSFSQKMLAQAAKACQYVRTASAKHPQRSRKGIREEPGHESVYLSPWLKQPEEAGRTNAPANRKGLQSEDCRPVDRTEYLPCICRGSHTADTNYFMKRLGRSRLI